MQMKKTGKVTFGFSKKTFKKFIPKKIKCKNGQKVMIMQEKYSINVYWIRNYDIYQVIMVKGLITQTRLR